MWSSDSEDENIVNIGQNLQVQRNYRERVNFNIFNAHEHKERFRMSSVKLEALVLDIGHILDHPTNRSSSLSTKQQLCIALHWLGNGGQYHAVGDMHGVSKASVCRCVHAVVRAVNMIKFQEVVNWPQNKEGVVLGFHNIAGMPHVVGCVDGTLINIDSPTLNEVAFVDRHGKHSINCMVVCGPGLHFYYASANWPGSVHDARVLRNSNLCQRMDTGWRPYPNSVILGDSGYPLKEWLIPPTYNNQADLVVQRFNQAHKSTRRVIENAIGILKEKFPCLNHLRVNPIFAAEIFICCVTLCNISREADEQQILENAINGDDDDGAPEPADEEPVPHAQQRLMQLINHFNY